MEYTVKEIAHTYGVARVHIPILDEAERTKRMHRLMDATEKFMKEVYKCRAKKEL